MTTVVTYYPGYSQLQTQVNLRCQDIASVTRANPCVVTTVDDHGYSAGVKVRFLVPTQYGMAQLNLVNAQVISVTANTLTLDVDSSNFNTFQYPSPLPSAYTPPSVIPNSSGLPLPPIPLPYGNQDSFEGAIYNDGVV